MDDLHVPVWLMNVPPGRMNAIHGRIQLPDGHMEAIHGWIQAWNSHVQTATATIAAPKSLTSVARTGVARALDPNGQFVLAANSA